MDHQEITNLAAKEQPGADGVNFLPFLTGERSPNWPDSYGVLTGLRPGALQPGRLYRAALEGATFPLLYGTCPRSYHHISLKHNNLKAPKGRQTGKRGTCDRVAITAAIQVYSNQWQIWDGTVEDCAQEYLGCNSKTFSPC